MNNVPVEQICEVVIVRIDEDSTRQESEHKLSDGVELAYKAIYRRAVADGKVLVGINQSINTETGKIGEVYYVLYIVTLVGTVVDAAAVEAQQRMQQFDPRNAIRGRNN